MSKKSAPDMDNVEEDALIAEVKSRPVIWDKSHELYRFKIEKMKAWEEICGVLCEDYRGRTAAEKYEVASKLQRKWKVLRDGFTRELSKRRRESPAGVHRRKQYVFFRKLKFLYKNMSAKKDIIEYGDESQDEHHYAETDHVKSEDISKQSYDGKHNNFPKKYYKTLLAEKDNLSKVLTESVQSIVSNSVDENDEDRLFLLSLVKEFKRVPEDRKLDVKGDIINILRKARQINISCEPNQYTANAHYPPAQSESFDAEASHTQF